ncbi:hypothetical protein Ancab_029199 [Ancistrocladus abbreviatus]
MIHAEIGSRKSNIDCPLLMAPSPRLDRSLALCFCFAEDAQKVHSSAVSSSPVVLETYSVHSFFMFGFRVWWSLR